RQSGPLGEFVQDLVGELLVLGAIEHDPRLGTASRQEGRKACDKDPTASFHCMIPVCSTYSGHDPVDSAAFGLWTLAVIIGFDTARCCRRGGLQCIFSP